MRNSVSPPAFDPRRVVTATRGSIDVFDWVDGLRGIIPRVGRPRVPKGAPLVVSGWAVDPTSVEPPAAVALVIDHGAASPAESGLDRTDVRALLGPGTSQDVGFRALVPIEGLTPGGHEIRAYVLGADGAWYDAAQQSFRVYAGVDPTLGVRAGAVRLSIDSVIDVPLAGPRGPLDGIVPLGDVALVAGWAIDHDDGCAPAGVCAIDASGRAWSAPCDMPRNDVRAAIGGASDNVGFEIAIPADALGRGRHRLEISAFDAGGRRYGRAQHVEFDVAAETRSFPGFARRSDDRIDAAVLLAEDDRSPVLGPRSVVERPRGAILSLQGWALAGDESAAQIFLELHPSHVAIPPLRYQAISGFRRSRPPRELPEPPRDDVWFACDIDTANVACGRYALRIAVVRESRCFYARGELGAVRVFDPESDDAARRL